MRVLYISFFFPPYNCVGAVRSGKLVKWLSRLGEDVRVISATPQALPKALALEVDRQRVFYSAWVDLDGVIRNLLEKAKKVRGLEKIGKIEEEEILLKGKKIGEKWYRSFFHWPDGQRGWVKPAFRGTIEWLGKWRPDVIYASAQPYSSFILACRLANKFCVPWIAEFRDLWAGNHYLDFLPAWRLKIDQLWERKLLQSAKALVTVSDPLAETLRQRYPEKPVLVLPNGWDPEDVKDHDVVGIGRCEKKSEFLIVYTGILYEEKQDISPLFKAIRELPDVRVEFYGRQFDYARVMARNLDVTEKVMFYPPVPRDKALSLQRRADALLLVLWNDPRERGVYTGKLFEYLASGRPILAIGPKNNVAAELILRLGAGDVASSTEEVLQILRQWKKDRPSGVAREKIMEWSHPRLADRLSKFLYEVAGRL